jgi:glucose/arabinose dehydrogenase
MPRVLPLITVGVVAAVLAGCSVPTTGTTTPADAQGVQPVGTPVDITTGLTSPWSMARIHDRDPTGVLVSQRDDGAVYLLLPNLTTGTAPYTAEKLGTVPGVVHEGEGGLLGIATYEDESATTWLYAYETTETDNRIIRIAIGDTPGLTAPPEVVLSGLEKASNHNGGRIAFGPDGMLYATVGDATDGTQSQDLNSLNGKILRMTPTGDVPSDNPFPGSLVYSLGHRNPQGLAWDSDGQLWASEFGQDTWDEFNRIVPGGNYGWPSIEGKKTSNVEIENYQDPWAVWPTDDASPSGLTYIDGTFFMAGLGGERLWVIYVDEAAGTADPVEYYTGEYGRIRDVAPGPGGSLWMLTDNTDGRGSPRDGDDRILQVRLSELVEG